MGRLPLQTRTFGLRHYSVTRGMSEAVSQPGVFSRGRFVPQVGGSALAGGVALVGVGGIAAASGGYFPTSWGWAALAFAWVAAITVLLRADTDVGLLDLGFFGL